MKIKIAVVDFYTVDPESILNQVELSGSPESISRIVDVLNTYTEVHAKIESCKHLCGFDCGGDVSKIHSILEPTAVVKRIYADANRQTDYFDEPTIKLIEVLNSAVYFTNHDPNAEIYILWMKVAEHEDDFKNTLQQLVTARKNEIMESLDFNLLYDVCKWLSTQSYGWAYPDEYTDDPTGMEIRKCLERLIEDSRENILRQYHDLPTGSHEESTTLRAHYACGRWDVDMNVTIWDHEIKYFSLNCIFNLDYSMSDPYRLCPDGRYRDEFDDVVKIK